MLKTTVNTVDSIISVLMSSEDSSSDIDSYNGNLLSSAQTSAINPIIDGEVYEYKPDKINTINFNIFFLRYLQNFDISGMTPYMETNFSTQIYNTKVALGILNPDGSSADRGINNLFEVRQDNNLREPKALSDIQKTNLQAVQSRPYYSADPIGEASIIRPLKPGLPIFYNSFTIPFWGNYLDWINNPLLYKNKPYFYNSFLFMEVFDSPITTTQNRLFSTPIFINQRYNLFEQNITDNFTYERPCFVLSDGFEGYSMFFLEKYNTNNFYVKFSFWDALNAVKIPLIPSSKSENEKKWFQNVTTFNKDSIYLNYVLDYTNKTYTIYEYNYLTNSYDLDRSSFDLYELAFDPYYQDFFVPNLTPVDVSQVQPPISPTIPFKFNIKNLIRTIYYDANNSTVNPYSLTLTANDNQTYLNATSNLVNAYASYITQQVTPAISFYSFNNNQTLNLPVINKTITGFSNKITTFTTTNIDTVDWTVTKLNFENIIISTNNAIYSGNTYYNNNSNATNKIAEALTYLSTNSNVVNNPTIAQLSYYLFYSVDFFSNLLNEIQTNRLTFTKNNINIISNVLSSTILDNNGNIDYYITGYTYDNTLPFLIDPIANFLTKIYNLFNISLPSYHQNNFCGLKPITNQAIIPYWDSPSVYDIGYNNLYVSELTDYIPLLISKYETERDSNSQLYQEVLTYIDILLTTNAPNNSSNFSGSTLNYVINNFSAANSPNYITLYEQICSIINDGLNSNDDTNIRNLSINNISQYIDNPKYNGEIRDYLFDLVLTYSGSSIVIPNQSIPLTLSFNIGKKANFNFINCNNITIKGDVKLSINNGQNDMFIYIPLNISLKVGSPSVSTYLSAVVNNNNFKLNV